MLRIGDFSKIARVTVKTLRYYDKIGLLKPAFIDVNTGYRYYNEQQIFDIHAILSYKNAGLSNEEVKSLLSNPNNKPEVLRKCKQKLALKMQAIDEQIKHIDFLLSKRTQEEYQVVVKTIPKCKVFYCCGYVSESNRIPSFIRDSHKQALSVNPNIRFPKPDYCCIIYPLDEYYESNIFVEYAQSVEEFGKESEIIKFKELEEVTAISVVHHGSYETLSSAYLSAVEWAQKNGFVLRGDARERYIHGEWDRQNQSEWETEIQLPIAKER